MKLNGVKIEMELAKRGLSYSDIKSISRETLRRMRKGENIYPPTVYRFCEEIGCQVESITDSADSWGVYRD